MKLNLDKCLVTGGSGSVGRNIPFGIKISSKDCDLRDAVAVDKLFAQHDFESILHLGASVGGLGAHINPKFRYNLLFDNIAINLNVIHHARKHNIKRVLSYLSSCVFSDSCPSPYTEKMIYDGIPSSVHESYAHAKRLLAVHNQICWDEGFHFSSLIPINLYGPSDEFSPVKSHFVASLILKAYQASKTGEKFVCWGNGSQIRDVMYLPDMVDITTYLLENYFDREPVIVCSENPVEIGHIAELIAEKFDIKKQLTFDTGQPVGQKHRVLSGQKLKSILPNYKFTSVKDGISKTIDWFLANYPNIRL